MQERFTLRVLAPEDEPFLWEMLFHAIHVPAGQPPPPRTILNEPQLAHYVRDWGHWPGDLGFLAEENSTRQRTGAVWLRLFARQDPGYGFVDDHIPELSIAILPGYRGMGLGSLLLGALLQAAEGLFPAVSLSVSS